MMNKKQMEEALSQVMAENSRNLEKLSSIVKRLQSRDDGVGTLSIRQGDGSRKYYIGNYSFLREAAETMKTPLSKHFGLFFDFAETKVVIRNTESMEAAKWEIEIECTAPLTPEEKEEVYSTEKRLQMNEEEGTL